MLKLEVAVPAPGMDFDFNEARPLPFLSAPSTPKRFGDYTLSAPTSPSRVAEFYSYFDSLVDDSNEETTGVPFRWEERPGTPKSPRATTNSNNEDDFAFDFSAKLEEKSLSADELFDGGKIRPLKLPPARLQAEDSTQRSPRSSPRSPIQKGKTMIREVFSPRKKKDSDPFATAVEKTRKRTENERGRGRERDSGLTSSSSRKASRSLSPCRVSEYPWEEEKQLQKITNQSAPNSKTLVSSSSSSSKSSSKKWRLKDFLLFRSASEGHAHDKDLRKYSGLFRKNIDGKEQGLRSTDSSGSVSSRRKGPVSAHELHYTVNKAVSENMKKKTFLPYKQGIFGRLAFNPAAHALSNGFGTFTR
ncbi:unnamed protein product [Dovyalis caffra]|uniref:Uncharacterized protein n=1 Tax=Dovyalis caffra TaxID=77055 RepID=A0AAV1S9L4_9ROSI|nr:unnamed protein product [Dovyalis caffra]